MCELTDVALTYHTRARNKRELAAKLTGSTLGDQPTEDAAAWAKKARKRAKELAAERALVAKREQEQLELDELGKADLYSESTSRRLLSLTARQSLGADCSHAADTFVLLLQRICLASRFRMTSAISRRASTFSLSRMGEFLTAMVSFALRKLSCLVPLLIRCVPCALQRTSSRTRISSDWRAMPRAKSSRRSSPATQLTTTTSSTKAGSASRRRS